MKKWRDSIHIAAILGDTLSLRLSPIPDRRAGSSEKKSAPPLPQPAIYTAAWLAPPAGEEHRPQAGPRTCARRRRAWPHRARNHSAAEPGKRKPMHAHHRLKRTKKRSNFIELYKNAGMKETGRHGFPLQVCLRYKPLAVESLKSRSQSWQHRRHGRSYPHWLCFPR
jgi:hypothetical protein